jgi:hypothetical protein
MLFYFILSMLIFSCDALPADPGAVSTGAHLAARSTLGVPVMALGTSEATPSAQGWTNSPDGRGTINIIWSCFLTVFLCGWTTICVNVPPLGGSKMGNMFRKLLVFAEALAGPEFIFQNAMGQYFSAHRSVREFTDLGLQGWTARHAFFADMGGFVLEPLDFPTFPVTASQLHYLVARGYVDFGDIDLTLQEIDDKNKFDALTRVITIVQLLWFLASVVARAILGMAITTLELSTICFIFCTLFTCYFWREKPQDVACPKIIRPKATMKEILLKAGPIAARPYSYTPLDFVARKPHWFERVWRFTFNLPGIIGLHVHPRRRPVDKIWDDQWYELPPGAEVLLIFVQGGFIGLHFAAWNWFFPTDIERWMWHVSSIILACCMVFVWTVIYWSYGAWPWLRVKLGLRRKPATLPLPRPPPLSSPTDIPLPGPVKRLTGIHFNTSSDKNPSESLPLLVVVIFVPLSGLYCLARLYIILEDIINLRNLPPSAFGTVDWSKFVPHF